MSATTSGEFILNDETTKRITSLVPADASLWLEPRDILVQRANTIEYVGVAAVFDGPRKTYIYPDLMMRIRPREHLADAAYLWRFINSHEAKTYLRDRATGTAGNMPKISGTTLRELPVLLPPYAEQLRIIAKLDTLTAKSRRAKEALDAIPALLERFRQSVLAAAFRGDLTADWREKNPDVEPAEELLKRIRAERRQRWEEAELAKMRAKGKVVGDDRWKERYEEPPPVDASELPELPDGWCWASVDCVCTHIVDCLHRTPVYVEAGYPAIRTADVVRGRLLLETARRVTESTYLEQIGRLEPKPGDIVYTREGERFGLAALVPEGAKLCLSQRMMQFRVVTHVDPSFFMWALNSPHVYGQAVDDVGGSTSPHVNISAIRRFTIPLASLAEQMEIAHRIETSWAASDAIEQASKDTAEHVSALDRAILAKAFRGELVPQDPNDEPASALLERIRAEATPNGQPTNGARRPRKPALPESSKPSTTGRGRKSATSGR
ncbi:restriction endonuclease subunit S [Sorangium sp. So ce1099]|uniref:restriction endonuclease subunit S n=1 Tax=Sorangium sp. So ce1099 TaxID=3133331 RepID=UPI003F612A6D